MLFPPSCLVMKIKQVFTLAIHLYRSLPKLFESLPLREKTHRFWTRSLSLHCFARVLFLKKHTCLMNFSITNHPIFVESTYKKSAVLKYGKKPSPQRHIEVFCPRCRGWGVVLLLHVVYHPLKLDILVWFHSTAQVAMRPCWEVHIATGKT